ncbi:MAG: Fic family protein [Candidatus Woesearchaeota archaeon]
MVTIIERNIGNKRYYYLVHSFRNNKKMFTKEKYLGSEIPKNIEELKKAFVQEIYVQEWYSKFEQIRKNYAAEEKKLPKSAIDKEINNFMIKFTYDTNRIEGSTLTLKETARLLEEGIAPSRKPLSDAKETEAHRDLFYEMLKYNRDLNLQIVLYWNKQLLKSTKQDIAGKIRTHQVAIAGSKFLPPSPVEVAPALEEFFSWYSKNKDKINPVELAALVHLKFVTIHPFTDGNGRISRLMMNFVLHKKGFPLLNIPYVKRSGYYTALERSQIKKEERIFLQWFFRRYLEEWKRYWK